MEGEITVLVEKHLWRSLLHAYFVQNQHPIWPALCSTGSCIVQKKLPAGSFAKVLKVHSLPYYVDFGGINLNLHDCKDRWDLGP